MRDNKLYILIWTAENPRDGTFDLCTENNVTAVRHLQGEIDQPLVSSSNC